MAVFQYSDNLPVFTASVQKLYCWQIFTLLGGFHYLKHIHANLSLGFGMVEEHCMMMKSMAIITRVEFLNENK